MEHLDDQQNLNYQFDTHDKSGQLSYNKPPNLNSKLCTFYSNFGFCKFGQNCKFFHRKKNYSSNKPSQRKSESKRNDVLFKLPNKVVSNHLNHDPNSNEKVLKSFQKRTCRYYKAGQCDRGENCLYNHDLDCNKFKRDITVQSNKIDNVTKDVKATTSKKKSIPICYYFKRGSCLKGDQCKYYHNPKYQKDCRNTVSFIDETNISNLQSNGKEEACNKNQECNFDISILPEIVNSENDGNLLPTSELSANHGDSKALKETKYLNINASIGGTSNNQARIQFAPHSRIFNLDAFSEDSLYQLRNTEITQLKKRFPKLVENGSSFTFHFEPTDPDWPFETKSLHLQATFPENYPLEVCDISVVSHMNFIPGNLLRHLNQSICDWLSEKHNAAIELNQVILLFRPFLKWFDKNLEELYNVGLKKVTEDKGDQNIVDNSTLSESISALSVENHIEDDLPEEESSVSLNKASTQAELEKEINHSPPRSRPILNNSQMMGSKIIFTGLELVEGVAVLSCKKLALTINCGRCKTSLNKILIPNKNTPMGCSKCSKNMECNFNPSVLHQFSNVLGILYLLECQAVDINLVECAFLVDCLSCTKQVSVDGLHYGQKQKLWCKFCNQKLIIGIESVKFQASAGAAMTASNKTVAVKKVTKVKDPVIKEGCPLPDSGTCKHYKKSYRWLRFPCCGRLYPCDVCHDEKEKDHDTKLASRMVCGFCSKEQPYSRDKPCFGCSSNMTKKSGSYWEGGQGCRNSVSMSRKDVHKYAGMSKTISKKSQPTGKKKK